MAARAASKSTTSAGSARPSSGARSKATATKAPTKAPTKAVKAKTSATKAPTKAVKAKASATKAPAKTVKAKATATKAPAKTAKSPAKAPTTAAKAPAKTPAKAVKAPVATAAKPAKAAPPKRTKFDAKFLQEQRDELVRARDERLRQSELLRAEAISLTENREPGDVQFDEESGEGDTLAVERERDLALSAQALAEVEEIDAALLRIDDATYGICRVSGEMIPKERLKAIPWATERVEYKVGGFARR